MEVFESPPLLRDIGIPQADNSAEGNLSKQETIHPAKCKLDVLQNKGWQTDSTSCFRH